MTIGFARTASQRLSHVGLVVAPRARGPAVARGAAAVATCLPPAWPPAGPGARAASSPPRRRPRRRAKCVRCATRRSRAASRCASRSAQPRARAPDRHPQPAARGVAGAARVLPQVPRKAGASRQPEGDPSCSRVRRAAVHQDGGALDADRRRASRSPATSLFASGMRIDGRVRGDVAGRPGDGGTSTLLVLSAKGRIEGSVRAATPSSTAPSSAISTSRIASSCSPTRASPARSAIGSCRWMSARRCRDIWSASSRRRRR